MKKILLYSVTLLSVLLLSACDHRHNRDNYDNIDNTPPSPPVGLVVTNGDNSVDLSWNQNYEHDVEGYNVYSSYDYYGKYSLIGSTRNNYYTDYGARNGKTYYYAVTAYDYNGNESDLSKQNISATPRPQGLGESVTDYHYNPANSGYSFATYSVVPYTSQKVDFFYDNTNGTSYIDIYNDTYIQDAGPTTDIYDIPYAPTTGWTTATSAIAIPGHTYVIWTVDNNYAKIRITSVTNNKLVFDWAYQTVQGNTQLKISNVQAKRNALNRKPLSR
jgi:hypothetical protein